MQLREPQQQAVDAAFNWIRKHTSPCLIEAPTAWGKSFAVAALASRIHKLSGKGVLCLAPKKELVEQNSSKYRLTGERYSLYSASVGMKCVRNPVVFGSPKTVLNGIRDFKNIGAVIIDEAHGITPTLLSIIEKLKEQNPLIRVVGMTATPYRTGEGYIYAVNIDSQPVPAKDPFFQQLVYRSTVDEMIALGFLTRPTLIKGDGYDTTGLEVNRNGKFNNNEVKKTFEGRGRLTSDIVADALTKIDGRFVTMFFGATIDHCREICESLPPDQTEMVTGKTPKEERARIIRAIKQGLIKYVVNVDVLTTGFDSINIGNIVMLRKTESLGLFVQIVGRGIRLMNIKSDLSDTETKSQLCGMYDTDDVEYAYIRFQSTYKLTELHKETCLVLDYAGNIDRHQPENGSIFDPDIKVSESSEAERVDVCCPDCGHINSFARDSAHEGFQMNANGFVVDAFGNLIINPVNEMPIPAHKGMRCQNVTPTASGDVRCSYIWNPKVCKCGQHNVITARYCSACQEELVDPNKNLALAEAVKEQRRMLKEQGFKRAKVVLVEGRKATNSYEVKYMLENGDYVREYLVVNHKKEWIAASAIRRLVSFGMTGVSTETSHNEIDTFFSAGVPAPKRIIYRPVQNHSASEIISVVF